VRQMTNRFAAAARWLAEQAKIYFWPGPKIPVAKKRRRTTGVLKAVLAVLEEGPCPVSEIMSRASIAAGAELVGVGDVAFYRPVYTRAQVVAALRYAATIGRVCRDDKGRWALMPPAKPGEWFPAKFGVSRGVVQPEAASPRNVYVDTGHPVEGWAGDKDDAPDLGPVMAEDEYLRLKAQIDEPPEAASGCAEVVE